MATPTATAAFGNPVPNPAPAPATLGAVELEAEGKLLDMIERGLRSEARRYGLDLDAWGTQ